MQIRVFATIVSLILLLPLAHQLDCPSRVLLGAAAAVGAAGVARWVRRRAEAFDVRLRRAIEERAQLAERRACRSIARLEERVTACSRESVVRGPVENTTQV